ncbi:SDR family NAD(P)-dependent oxidoreductase [Desertihabitans brevis]|uniref:SDR family NAD(P)-dependent oxidoreductase n=1 Tax=Desertihabitans brevis TaxID=2268447 RepID=A0A367YSD0_9ACTN|nr:SDR family oxidoreductase [Desertihabitans brevis]RCK68657.1 SDR family NAD(P)-dependent oxidoreductase [Desertihabitans brevis]
MTAPLTLVAGASRGLGFLIARELLERGHRVVLCARDPDGVQSAVERLSEHGEVHGETCDVADRADVERLISSVEAAHGPLDALFCVAGVIQVGPAEEMTLEHFDEAIDIMLRGPLHLVWTALPGMRERRRGRIGVVTSIGGVVAPPHLLPYATAKFGALGFAEGLVAELAGSGVTATAVVPGLMRTGSHEEALFTGDQALEYDWFAPAASLPLLSTDAERAASRIVDGVLAGRARIVLTPAASLAQRVHGIAPGLTTRAMGLVSRLLPDAADGPTGTVPGHEAGRRSSSGLVTVLTTLGRRAADRYNTRAHRR